MKFLDNEGEKEVVEEQREKMVFLEVLEIGGNKLVDIWEGKILEDCGDNVLEFGSLARLVQLQLGWLLTWFEYCRCVK